MSDEKFALRQKSRRAYYLHTALNGWNKVWLKKWPIFLLVLTFVAVAFSAAAAHSLQEQAFSFTAVLAYAVGVPLLLFVVGYTPGANKIHEDFLRIGLVNSAGEVPVLLGRNQKAGNLRIMRFWAKGFPLSIWEDRKEEIESALNITIVRFLEGSSKREVDMEYVPGNIVLPHLIPWEPARLSKKDFEIAVGESILGPVYIDLAKTPHVLIGGTTSSGKTKLLELIGEQVIDKCASLMIVDYKGVDYGQLARRAMIAGNHEEFLSALDYLTDELEKRKAAFVELGCRNISEYNAKSDSSMRRIVLLVDEASFVFDTTGVTDKGTKEKVSNILGALINLTRVGRFAGIHIIVATQRPDAISVPGSLKANLDTRICGRMPDVATSTVILDDGSATNLPSIKGRFLLRDGSGTDTVFQAYLLDE